MINADADSDTSLPRTRAIPWQSDASRLLYRDPALIILFMVYLTSSTRHPRTPDWCRAAVVSSGDGPPRVLCNWSRRMQEHLRKRRDYTSSFFAWRKQPTTCAWGSSKLAFGGDGSLQKLEGSLSHSSLCWSNNLIVSSSGPRYSPSFAKRTLSFCLSVMLYFISFDKSLSVNKKSFISPRIADRHLASSISSVTA